MSEEYVKRTEKRVEMITAKSGKVAKNDVVPSDEEGAPDILTIPMTAGRAPVKAQDESEDVDENEED